MCKVLKKHTPFIQGLDRHPTQCIDTLKEVLSPPDYRWHQTLLSKLGTGTTITSTPRKSVLDGTRLRLGTGTTISQNILQYKKISFHIKTQYRQLFMLESGTQTGTYVSLTVSFNRHPLIYPGLGLAPSDVFQSKK